MDVNDQVKIILNELKAMGSEKNREGMARFGIATENAYGVSVKMIRQLARQHRKKHGLALALWQTGVHEARIMAAIVDDPAKVTPEQMDEWMRDFDSWDLCDQACSLFDKTPYAVQKIREWVRLESEFQRRAGYALLAEYAWHSKTESDETFLELLPLLIDGATDERNFVKKAVNWALREIGKRSHMLNLAAIACAEKMKQLDSKSARWIANDALRELQAEKTIARITR